MVIEMSPDRAGFSAPFPHWGLHAHYHRNFNCKSFAAAATPVTKRRTQMTPQNLMNTRGTRRMSSKCERHFGLLRDAPPPTPRNSPATRRIFNDVHGGQGQSCAIDIQANTPSSLMSFTRTSKFHSRVISSISRNSRRRFAVTEKSGVVESHLAYNEQICRQR